MMAVGAHMMQARAAVCDLMYSQAEALDIMF